MTDLRLIFIGPPGSGKGTQAKRLASRGFVHISTGDLLRRQVAAGSAEGQEVLQIMRRGGLAPDRVIFELIEDAMVRHRGSPMIFDGFPRTSDQAAWLASFRIDMACIFEISDAQVLRRLGNRVVGMDGAIYDLELLPPPPGVQYIRRVDDTPAIHRGRLQNYREQEAQLRDFYARNKLLQTVDASLPLGRVAEQMETLLSRLRYDGKQSVPQCISSS